VEFHLWLCAFGEQQGSNAESTPKIQWGGEGKKETILFGIIEN
jgi:hypothetical protein